MQMQLGTGVLQQTVGEQIELKVQMVVLPGVDDEYVVVRGEAIQVRAQLKLGGGIVKQIVRWPQNRRNCRGRGLDVRISPRLLFLRMREFIETARKKGRKDIAANQEMRIGENN